MSQNEPYTLLDAIREEIKTLEELEAIYKKDDKWIAENIVASQRYSLERILNRFEKGFDYYLGVNKEGNPQMKVRQTTRHLEREYPAVAKAKANLDIVVDLSKGKDDV